MTTENMVLYGAILALFLVLGLLLALVGAAQRAEATDAMRERRKRALGRSPLLRLADPLVVGFAALVRKLGLEGHRASAGRLLVRAGNPWGYAAEEYVGLCITNALLAFLLGLLVFSTFSGELSVGKALLLGVVGYWFTWSSLRAAARTRRVRIDRQMPFVLDLLSLTMGAGSSFLQSCETAVEGTSRGPLQDELAQMLHEVRAGTPLRDALQNMTKRTDSEEVGLFVAAVCQGEELGTPLTQIFETQSSMNRFRRTNAAEQAAAKIPNRMAVPTTLLMLSVLLLLFGPIIVKAVRGGMF